VALNIAVDEAIAQPESIADCRNEAADAIFEAFPGIERTFG
jgi:hypothetical protein